MFTLSRIRTASICLMTCVLTLGISSDVTNAGYFRDRDFFTNKFARKFYLRGRCFISKGNGDIVVDVANGAIQVASAVSKKVPDVSIPDSAKQVFPHAGDSKCIVKKRKRARGAIRASGTVTVNMNLYKASCSKPGCDVTNVIATRRSKSCGGKNRCTVIMRADKLPITGMTACLEAKRKSRVVKVGGVADGLDSGFKNVSCSSRRY